MKLLSSRSVFWASWRNRLMILSLVLTNWSCVSREASSPYNIGEGFQLGDGSAEKQPFAFKCPHGGQTRLLLLFPRSASVQTNLSGNIEVSHLGSNVWRSAFSAATMRECTSWLRRDLSETYRAFIPHEGNLDESVTPGKVYDVTITFANGPPEGWTLYLFRLTWYNQLTP